jgi:formate dehydrogenase assembly factor FdhD
MICKKYSLIMMVTGVALFLITSGIYAGTKFEDEIRLKNKAYANHKEDAVIFQHRKHQEEYRKRNSELFSSQCGECHHEKVNDKKNKPLSGLKEGDAVKKCIKCHKKAAYAKGKKAKKLSAVQKREYHANAMHDNCKTCHKKYNKKKGLKSKDKGYAPNTCKSCHSKSRA